MPHFHFVRAQIRAKLLFSRTNGDQEYIRSGFKLVCLFVQQDVSEFTHKLLDWLEDAFQIKAEEDR